MMRTYGVYTFRDDSVAVKLEPMAAVRFKRVFEKAAKGAAEWIRLMASPENVRELEWFMGRYPLSPETAADAERLDALAREFDRALELVARIMAPDYVPPMVSLALPPRPYQLLPAAMLAATGGVLVGDEVGLGKTVEGIVALAQPDALPALVVTLTHLPRQWDREIHRFAPTLSTYVLRKGTPSRQTDAKGQQPQDLAAHVARTGKVPDVVITSYSKIAGWAEWLITNVKPRTVIWDEVQEFRTGFHTNRGNAGKFIADRVARRMGLSATPIHNEGAEIHPVIETILPGSLGTREEFLREWCPDGMHVKQPAVLGSYLRERGVFIRRTKAEVGRELPPLSIAEQFCDADTAVLEALRTDARAVELAKFVLSGTRQAFQASGEFDMFVRQRTGVAKAPFVAAFANMLLESGEPVVLYGWHHEVYDLWRELLGKHHPAFFTGLQSVPQKDEAVRRFREGETKLFIISLRAGAGLDGLQFAGCSNVVFGELDWSPAIHEQAIGRVRRDGIETPVTAWFLVSDEGSDPVIAERLGVKRGQLEGIRDPNGGVVSGQIDGDAVKRLAADFLARRGIAIPARPPVEEPSLNLFDGAQPVAEGLAS
jgi:SNF2 family DNA or RNA helicase